MDQMLPKSKARKDPEIAAAEWLLQDTPAGPLSPPAASPVPDGAEDASPEGFALVEPLEKAPVPAPSQSRPAPPLADPASAAAANRSRSRMTVPGSPPVEQVWSRASEWGPTFFALFCWGFLSLALVYFSVGAELYGLAAMVFAAGCAGGLLLCYPILITLERPVRVTPEQAVRDYFGALSHHIPHYRRMWLLLSARGRTCPQFASFEGFRSYWNRQLVQLKGARGGALTPLVFQVEDFQNEKSAGRTEIGVEFRLRVLIRGRRSQGPVLNVALHPSLVRGPDGMWYLDDGTITDRAATGLREPALSNQPPDGARG